MIKISFIIPAYNEERNIYDCVISIQREADYYPFVCEIIVIDNLSEDRTGDEAERAGATFVYRTGPKGLVNARQAGVDISNGEYLAFIDADCQLPRGWIKSALDNFSVPEVAAVSGALRYHDWPELDKYAKHFFKVGRFFNDHWRPMLQGGNFIIRKSALDAIGGFDTKTTQYWGEDALTAYRLSNQGKIILSMDMWAYASARRFKQDGLVKTVGLYIANYVAINVLNAPINKEYKNFR